jgi:putative transposase
MPHYAAIVSLPQAERVIKSMGLRGYEFGEDYRTSCRQASKEFFESRMDDYISRHLEELEVRGEYDRRNGTYSRHLLTEVGDIELDVPRTRTFSAVGVLQRYARRAARVEHTILAGFLLGLSTRKVSQVLMRILDEPVSPTTVSRIAKTLDASVNAFHRRPLTNAYKVLLLDGVVLSRKTGLGAIKKTVLVALGLRPDGKKEIIDFCVATSESQAQWERFLTDLVRRGLSGEGLKLICVDGGAGLLAALPTVYPGVAIQRCWAHKMRNLTDKVRKVDRNKIKKALRKIYRAKSEATARKKAQAFAERWEQTYPKVVRSLRSDLDELLAFHCFKDETWRRATRTTNAIERRFVEVRRRTRPMGVFSNNTSMERILYAIFMQENRNQGTMTPFLLTQTT